MSENLPTGDEIDAEIRRADASIKYLELEFQIWIGHVSRIGAKIAELAGNQALKVGSQILADIAEGALLDLANVGQEFKTRLEKKKAERPGQFPLTT